MKIKKSYIIVTSVILVIIISLFAYKIHREKVYFKTASEFKTNVFTSYLLSSVILSQYSEIWGNTIQNGWIDIDGKKRYFSDFNESVGYTMNKFKIGGMFDSLGKLSSGISQEIKDMTPPPSKYKDIHANIVELYTDINELISLTKSPQGSLVQFNQKVRDLTSSISKNINILEISLPKDDSYNKADVIIKEYMSNLRLYYANNPEE